MKRIHLIILCLLITLTSVPGQLLAGNIYWYSGKGHVTYSIQKKHDCVVDKALDMFSDDMKAVTGKKAERDGSGVIDIHLALPFQCMTAMPPRRRAARATAPFGFSAREAPAARSPARTWRA